MWIYLGDESQPYNGSDRALDSHHYRDQRYCGQRLLNHLDGTGGQSLHKWSLASGTLPTGMTLSTAGVLAGIPSQSGTFNFTVSASDSEATPQVASQTFSLVVQAALSITTTTVTNAISGSAYSTTLTVRVTANPSYPECASRVEV